MVHSFGPESSASISAVSATEFLSKMAILCVCLGLGLVPAGLQAFPVNYTLVRTFQRRPSGIRGLRPSFPSHLYHEATCTTGR